MIIHEVEQGSDEWFELRSRRLTSSHGTSIGNCGKGLYTYVNSKVMALLRPKEHIITSDIQRGYDLEPLARLVYEMETKTKVKEVGFISYDDYIGCSPDGLIGKDGIWECKARNDDKHWKLIKGGKNESGVIWQCQMTMLITGRKWADISSYNPNFVQSLVTNRIYADEKAFEKLRAGFKKGTEMLKLELESKEFKKEYKNGKNIK